MPSIHKDGLYIKDDLDQEQIDKAVNKFVKSFSREIINNIRRDSISNLYKYIANTDKEDLAALDSIMIDVYTYCHIATKGKTATGIILEAIESGLTEDSIVTRNTLSGYDMWDFQSAINYYSLEELDSFGRNFDTMMNVILNYTRREDSTIEGITDVVKDMASVLIKTSGMVEEGAVIESPSRRAINKALDYIVENNFCISRKENQELIDRINRSRCRSISIS